MFLGREKELNLLGAMLGRQGKHVVMLYGRRRVGKTTLILKAVEDLPCKVIYYECLLTSLEENLRGLERKIGECLGNKFLHFTDFSELFEFLGSLPEKIVVVLDEYAYLKQLSAAGYVDSLFQRVADSLGDNVDLVLLGSFVGMMKEILEADNPLFGRFNLVLHILPFDYYDASVFYGDSTVREKTEFYAVFGGSPFVNTLLQPKKNLQTNVENLLLNDNSPVRLYLEHVLLGELRKGAGANQILLCLANGKKRYGELEQSLGLSSNGNLDKQLKILLAMEVVRKVYPINKREDKKKVFYEIGDNLVRFYYAYIYAGRDVLTRIGEKNYYNSYIAKNLPTFMAHRFEETVREFFVRRARNGDLADVLDVGTFWYDLPHEKEHGEFDAVLQYSDGYDFYEVKNYSQPLKLEEALKEAGKMRRCAAFVPVRKIGFVALGGFAFSGDDFNLVSGEELYLAGSR